MKIENETMKTLLTQGVPMAVSMCAGAVVSTLMKEKFPVPEKTSSKIIHKIGQYGLGLVATNAVMHAVSDEIEPVATVVLDIVYGPDKPSKPEPVPFSKEEIVENLDKGLKMTYDPISDEVTFEEV